MDDDYVDYNAEAELPDTCETLHTWGCTNPEALNYDSTATIADLIGPCTIQIVLEDDAADGWGNSTIGMVQGEQQWMFTVGPGEFNQSWDIVLDSDEEVDIYYFQAGNQQQSSQELAFQTLHNSVYVLNEAGDTLLSEGSNPFINNGQGALQPFTGPNWTVYHFTPYCGDSCIPYIYGCTDATACNFDAEANTNSECNYPVQYYDCNNSCINDYDGDGVCDELEVVGCQDPTAFNYNAAATDSGECIPIIFGCTDPTMFNYDSTANTENGSCIPYIYGCTDPNAFNYDSDANTDNDSCIEIVEGCTDAQAVNYDPLANTATESCYYSAGCAVGDIYYLPNGCFEWVISVDPYCCDNSWDSTCSTLYDYCEDGWDGPLTVDDLREGKISFYPNPTSDIVNIAANSTVDAVVYNSSGKKVLDVTNVNMLDLSKYSNGIYYVRVSYNEFIINHKIVKN